MNPFGYRLGVGTMAIGARLREIRGGQSQEDFAKRFGAHRNTVVRYEGGERSPDAEYLQAVCKAFPDIRPEWLLLGSGSMTRQEEKGEMAGAAVRYMEGYVKSDEVRETIQLTLEVFKENNLSLPPEKMARFIILAHNYLSDLRSGKELRGEKLSHKEMKGKVIELSSIAA